MICPDQFISRGVTYLDNIRKYTKGADAHFSIFILVPMSSLALPLHLARFSLVQLHVSSLFTFIIMHLCASHHPIVFV